MHYRAHLFYSWTKQEIPLQDAHLSELSLYEILKFVCHFLILYGAWYDSLWDFFQIMQLVD